MDAAGDAAGVAVIGRRLFVGALGSLAGAWVAAPALARPVPTGRFVRIPHGVPDDHAWRTGGGNPRRSFLASTRIPTTAPSQRWEARAGVGLTHTPALSREGLLYVASQAGVTCVDTGGSVQWSLRMGRPSGTPAFTPDGEVAIGFLPSSFAFAGPGGLRVLASVGGAPRGSLLVLDDGSVVAAAMDHAVYRVDPDGRTIFRLPVATRIAGNVTQIDTHLFAVPATRSVVFFDHEGHLVADVDVPGTPLPYLAATEGGELLALITDGTLLRLGPRGVRTRTRTDIAPSPASGLALGGDGSVHFGSRDQGLVHVLQQGRVVRNDPARGVVGELTVDADGASLAVDVHGRLTAFEPDGSVRWEVAGVARTDASPVIGADGTIYVASYGGALSAYRAEERAEAPRPT